jgi:thiamine biosynthesis lipoprotein
MIHKVEFRAMGTTIMAALECHDSEKAILQQVPTWFEYWEESLSRFKANSELSRLNHANGRWRTVSPIFWDVLRVSLVMEKRSQNLVTPGLLSALKAAGYDRSFEFLPDSNPADTTPPQKTMPVSGRIQINEVEHSVRISPGVELDFGGIGKGWAADQTAQALRSIGPCLVDAGGDIAVFGTLKDGSGWPVGIENPLDTQEELTQVEAINKGIATSGKNRRHWIKGGIFQHHILDPRTGLPAQNDVISATVIAPDVMQAEMAAKVINILGPEEGLTWLAKYSNYEALVVLTNGEILRSERFHEYERIYA